MERSGLQTCYSAGLTARASIVRSGVCGIGLLLGLSMSIRVHAGSETESALEALAAEASEAPAEFAADLLIRIAGSPHIADVWRRELLELAFSRAIGAQEPFKRAAPLAPIDSRPGSIERASATGLDTLTLQLRAVASLAASDARRAREMFGWIDFSLPPATCEAMPAPVADEYYATLSAIARRTFESTAEGRAEALRFFEIYLWRSHLPSEVPAVMKAVKAMKLSRQEAGYFEQALDAMMEHVEGDPRGFSTFGLDIVRWMSGLADSDRGDGVMGENLMLSERKLLAAQLSTGRCADSLAEGMIADRFNRIVARAELPPDVVMPLTLADMLPTAVLGAARPEPYWGTPDAQRLVLDVLALRDSAIGNQAIIIKRTAGWQADALRYLTALELWDGTHEPVERDYFDEKCLLYEVYLDILPPGELKTRALRSLVGFLRRSDTGRLPRAPWFANVKRLLERGDPEMLPAMEQSGHYLLSMYARAERLLSARRER
jgi:hypothetical protein